MVKDHILKRVEQSKMAAEETMTILVGVTTLLMGWLWDLEAVSMIFLGAVVWAVGWLFNSPIPKGHKNPWFLRAFFAFFKLVRIMDWFKGFVYTKKEVLISLRNLMKAPAQDHTYPVQAEDTTIAGVKVRVYRPNGCPADNNAAIVFYHGGGWVLGNVEMYNLFTMALAHKVQAIVFSVEYRLAPEHPYPAPLDDCVAVTRYLLEHPQQYGVDSSRVAIAGDSAGGNLTAAVALRLRDMKVSPQPKLQVLIYPCLQPIDFNGPSYQINHKHPLLRSIMMANCWLLYATGDMHDVSALLANNHTPPSIKAQLSKGQLNHDIVLTKYQYDGYVPNKLDFGNEKLWKKLEPVFMDPYFAPLMAKDLSELPEAVVITVEDDLLRDDGIWYAEYLKSAGVPVTHRHYMAGYHGILSTVFKQVNNIESREILYTLLNNKL